VSDSREPHQLNCGKTGCEGTLLMISSVKVFSKDIEEIKYIYKCSACGNETK
jgi:hypothetical protein